MYNTVCQLYFNLQLQCSAMHMYILFLCFYVTPNNNFRPPAQFACPESNILYTKEHYQRFSKFQAGGKGKEK